MVPQCCDKTFEDVKRNNFAYRWKSKVVWISITYSHQIRGKSTDALNIEKLKTCLNHKPRGVF